MPKSLTKVQKHIAKKKGRNVVLHENSRDSKRLQRAGARDDKLMRLTSARAKQNQPLLQRILFFHGVITEREPPSSLPDVQDLITEYLRRDDDDLEALKLERRAGRPPSTRETMLKQKQGEEELEYKSGLWIPDLEDSANVTALRDWGGEWVGLNTIKFVTIAKDGTKHASQFPPRKS